MNDIPASLGSCKGQHYTQSVSGGIASAASAILGAQIGLNQSLVFADTLVEDEDLYRFVNDVASYIGQPLITLRDGRDPYDVYVAKRYIGNTRTAHCSIILKTEQVRHWIAENAPTDTTLLLGMYLDEEDRLIRAQANWAPVNVSSLLIERGVFPGKARQIVKAAGIRTPRLYDDGFPHNNCGGGCCRAGQGQWATLLSLRPEVYAHHEKRLNWAIEQIGPTAKPFLRIVRDGVTEYVTLTEFRERVEAGILKPKMYDMGGCGCFVDDLVARMEA